MEAIRLWIMGVASAAVVGSVVLALTPNGGAEKAVKTIVSVFLILSMVIPVVKGADLNFEMQMPSQNNVVENSEKIASEMAEQFKADLNEAVEKILSENGIQTHEIRINIKIRNNEISVEKIIVILKKGSENSLASAQKLLENELGVRAEVFLEGVRE